VTDDTPRSNKANSEGKSLVSYVTKLERKIREQALRLSNLESYKLLCEMKIKSLKPEQTFPLNENDLALKETNLNEDFDTQNVKESYAILLESYKYLNAEKEEILKMLRKETLLNEENRNIIAVLQSDNIRSGAIMNYVNLENLIDFEKLKAEADGYKKELSLQTSININLRKEIEDLRESNQSLINAKDKFKKTLEDEVYEIEVYREKLKLLEEANTSNKNENENLKEENNKLIKEKDELSQRNSNLTIKIKEINKMSEEQNDIVVKRINDYRQNFEKLNSEFEIIIKEKTKLEIENLKINEEIITIKEQLEQIMNKNDKDKKLNADYKNLFDELSKDFDEYKKSNKKNVNTICEKIKKSSHEEQEKLLEENNQLIKENNTLVVEYENLENNFQNLQKDLEDINQDYQKLLENLEAESNKNKTLLCEKTNLILEINKLNEEKIFNKEKYEKDLNSKNKEIKSLEDEVSALKSEEIKLKEGIKELKKNLNEKEDLLEDSNIKVEKFEQVLIGHSEKDIKINEISEMLSQTSKKYKQALTENENLYKDIEKSNKLLTFTKIEKENIEQKLKQEIINIKIVEKNNEEKEKELENIKFDAVNKQEEFKILIEELNKFNIVRENLESLLSEKEESEKNLKSDKLKLENKISSLENEKHHLAQENYNLLENIRSLHDFKSEIKINLYTLNSFLKIAVSKFNSYANEDLDSLLSKNFSQNITKFLAQVSHYTTETEEKEIILTACDFLKTLGAEMENCYDKLIDSNNYIKEAHGKIIMLENSLNEASDSQKFWVEKEKKMKNLIQAIKEEKSAHENKVIEENQELIKEIALMRREREESFNDLVKIKNENYTLNSKINLLNSDLEKQAKDLEESNCNLMRAENKFLIIHREKKFTDNLLINFVRTYPAKEMNKLMTEVININEYIFKIEQEKMRIEDKLISMEKESKVLLEDKSSYNNDLSVIVQNELSNLKKLQTDYDKKIKEKKELQKVHENQIFNLESEVKLIFDKNLNLLTENKRLEKELENYRINFRDEKVNLYSHINDLGNKLEISCLDSNLSREAKPDPLLTNYESIELEYSDDLSKTKSLDSQTFNKIQNKAKNKPHQSNSQNILIINNDPQNLDKARKERINNIDKINVFSGSSSGTSNKRRDFNLI
jgi:hypothetical protein